MVELKFKLYDNYVSKMTSQTSVKSVWNWILNLYRRDIDTALSDTFSHNSSSAFITDAFASVRKKAEKQNVSTDNDEVYNKHLSMDELKDVPRKYHHSSVRPADVSYHLLKHLS